MITAAAVVAEVETLSACLLCDSARIQALDAEYDFYRCDACGYVFDNPRPTLVSIIRFYSAPQKYDSWLDAEDSREELWKRRLKKRREKRKILMFRFNFGIFGSREREDEF